MDTDTSPNVTNKMRCEILLAHLVNLTDQVRTLAGILRDRGIEVPATIGTLGPASEEIVASYTEESIRIHFPDDLPSNPGGPA